MNNIAIAKFLRSKAEKYNDDKYFRNDPIIFPKHFAKLYWNGEARLQDVEIAAVIAAHLAWGKREMIVRDCTRAMEEMRWKPFEYVMNGCYRNEDKSLHRTIKWSDFAIICKNLKKYYENNSTLERLTPDEIRVKIYNQKSNHSAANKKIHMLRRWMVRDDGKVDLGIWKNINKNELIIPLDIHVHKCSLNLGITKRQSTCYNTAKEITEYLKKVFPGDPVLGDFALFAASAEHDC